MFSKFETHSVFCCFIEVANELVDIHKNHTDKNYSHYRLRRRDKKKRKKNLFLNKKNIFHKVPQKNSVIKTTLFLNFNERFHSHTNLF